ncbi:hypothetical protein ACFV4P_33705 [Kitasatospora sp. NPDC059795]|uniref:hypothetical protein n=1 Tax=Kitasatospora sp. NPDC059795 TaxID=3346949 RepID=UPI00364C5A95
MGGRAALAVAAVGAIVLTAAGCSSNNDRYDCVEAAAPAKADTGIVLAKGKSGGRSSKGSSGSNGSKGSGGSGSKGSGTSPHSGGGGTRVVHHYHHRPGSTRSDDYVDECGNPSPTPGSGFGGFGNGDCATPGALPAATSATGSPSASSGGSASPSSAAPPVPCVSPSAGASVSGSPSAGPSPSASPSASRSGTR